MCDQHNHGEHEHSHAGIRVSRVSVPVMENILSANDRLAGHMRKRWAGQGTLVVNLLSSPGSGKTALLEKTIDRLIGRKRILVLEGDIETERDADRVRARGADAVTITTGGACHLEANLVEQAFVQADRGLPYDIIFVENVGNLVCPASYDLGEHLRVVLLSVPEGDDKPAKYPAAFRSAGLFVISKTDVLPHFDFDVVRATAEAQTLRPGLETIALSSKSGHGMNEWLALLETHRQAMAPVFAG